MKYYTVKCKHCDKWSVSSCKQETIANLITTCKYCKRKTKLWSPVNGHRTFFYGPYDRGLDAASKAIEVNGENKEIGFRTFGNLTE